ncbi:MAG: hypothetical protein JW958_01945 [Candidatus Eisenbacteria bacterium]|nr:hypothetical protein [Candidatus Eisenbacteria bacterium]
MYRKEVHQRSPLRIFEGSARGGLGRGNLGAVISRAGVGKSAFLVNVALDELMADRRVLHVAAGSPLDRVRNFYDKTFNELLRSACVTDTAFLRLSMERNRHIHCFAPGSFRTGSLYDEALSLRDHADFRPDLIILDDFPFESAVERDMEDLRRLATEFQAEAWLAALSHRHETPPDGGVHDPTQAFDAYLSVKLFLEPAGDRVKLRVLKDHENPDPAALTVDLDPSTLLIRNGD